MKRACLNGICKKRGHAAEFGLKQDENNAYKKTGYDIMRQADHVYAQVYEHKNGKSQLQFVFFSPKGQAVIGDDLQLYGVFHHSNHEKAFQYQRNKGLWLQFNNND